MLKVGARLACPECPTEVVVVRANDTDVSLSCSGSALVPLEQERPLGGHGDEGSGDKVALGKRYVDEEAGIELLCTKAGSGGLSCEGRALTLKSAKPLPSSD